MTSDASANGQSTVEARAEPASETDIRICYRLFLGREAESDVVVHEKLGMPADDLPRAFLSSAEFRDDVFRPIVEGRPWRSELFQGSIDVMLLDWIGRQFKISEQQLDRAEDWTALLRLLYEDKRFFLDNAGLDNENEHERFLIGLQNRAARIITHSEVSQQARTSASAAHSTYGHDDVGEVSYLDLETCIRDLCRDRSVHIVRATSVPLERLRLALEGGSTHLLLSDTPDKGLRCRALATKLRSQFPRANITTHDLRYDQYWDCRAMLRTDVVMELGSLIHEAVPTRYFAHLFPMALEIFGCASMVLPQTVVADQQIPSGTMLSWRDLSVPSPLTRAIDRAFQRRGINLPQLQKTGEVPRTMQDASWLWFPTIDGLIKLAAWSGARPLVIGHTWQDIAAWIEFRP